MDSEKNYQDSGGKELACTCLREDEGWLDRSDGCWPWTTSSAAVILETTVMIISRTIEAIFNVVGLTWEETRPPR